MTANEMRQMLDEVCAAGRGNEQVYIQHVMRGITMRESIEMCFAAEPYDGDFVWVIGRRILESPFACALPIEKAYA